MMETLQPLLQNLSASDPFFSWMWDMYSDAMNAQMAIFEFVVLHMDIIKGI